MGADGKVGLPGGQLSGDGFFLPGGGGAGQQHAADAQFFQQRGEAGEVLPGQNLRGGHQGRLTAVFHTEIHAGGGHHGLAGAHVSLTQAVHGGAGGHVGDGLLHAAPLGIGQGEGQRVVEGGHVHHLKGSHGHRLPPLPQTPQSDGEEKQLLEGQPPPGQVQRLGALREVDVLIGVFDAAEMVGLPYLVRERVGQDVGAGVQSLPYGPGEHQLADPGGEGIDGDDAAGALLPSLRLHHRGSHLPPPGGALRLAVKVVGLSLNQAVFQPGLVEKGDVQHAGLVHRPDFHQVHPLADVGHGGRRGDHGRHAGALAVLELGDAPGLPPVLVAPGKIADQVPQSENAQLLQGLGLLGADALDELHTGGQVRHGAPPFLHSTFVPLYNTRSGKTTRFFAKTL